jgi:hypothetical protein
MMLQRQVLVRLTFQVEKNVGLVVLEHLRHELCVHVLNVDLLQVLVQHHDGLVQFLLRLCQFVFTVVLVLVMTDNIDNDTGEQLALLMLVRAFLCALRSASRVMSSWNATLRTIFAMLVGLNVYGTRFGGCGED